VVSTAQPLGNLAALMLEPGCMDGLLSWTYSDVVQNPIQINFFDDCLDKKEGTIRYNFKSASGEDYVPVFKVLEFNALEAITPPRPPSGGGGGGGAQSSSISQTRPGFDASKGDDLVITLTPRPSNNKLIALKNGDTTLREGTDYTVDGNVYTIKAGYLAGLGDGTHAITFDMTRGADPKCTVTVSNSDAEVTEPTEPEEPEDTGYKPMTPQDTAGATVAASKTNNTLILGEKETDFPAVKIRDWNWLKLRDFAMLMNGTAKRFSVSYEQETNSIYVVTGQAYTPYKDELDPLPDISSAISSPQHLYVNGRLVNVAAYNILGYNYFRLRDLAIILDIEVVYSADEATVTLNLDKPYSEDQ
jgi:hypothetical protein